MGDFSNLLMHDTESNVCAYAYKVKSLRSYANWINAKGENSITKKGEAFVALYKKHVWEIK